MALTDLPDSYLADFGVDCVAGSTTAKGILDMPGQVIAGDMVLTTDFTLTAKAADFGDLIYGSEITVNGVAYVVRETRLVDDGLFCEISLQRSVATSVTTSSTGINAGDSDDTVDDLGNAQLDAGLNGGTASTSYLDGNIVNGGSA
jgi:hypothetical protein